MLEDINDYEAIMLVNENNEEAEALLLKKYTYLIKYLLKESSSILNKLNIDYNDIYIDSLMALLKATTSYQDQKDALFKTYATLVISRNIKKYIVNASRKKNKINNEAINFSTIESTNNVPIESFVPDERYNPLDNLIEHEKIKEFRKLITEKLSTFERNVIELLISGLSCMEIAKVLNKNPKQIYNTIQRIRKKLRKQNN